MQVIEIEDDVWEALQRHAEPLVDTVDSVMRRLLGMNSRSSSPSPPRGPTSPGTDVAAHARLDASHPLRSSGRRSAGSRGRPTRPRARRGALVPQSAYEQPLIDALRAAGGTTSTQEALDAVGLRMKGLFTELDLEELRPGLPRWQSRTHFVRRDLVKRGLISDDGPRGMWSLTDTGMTYNSNKEPKPSEQNKGDTHDY